MIKSQRLPFAVLFILGKQMEHDGLEWSCPPCTKKKRVEEKEKEVVKPTIKISSKGSEMRQTVQTKLSFASKRPSSEEVPERYSFMDYKFFGAIGTKKLPHLL